MRLQCSPTTPNAFFCLADWTDLLQDHEFIDDYHWTAADDPHPIRQGCSYASHARGMRRSLVAH